MRTLEDLERLWRAMPPAPRDRGRVQAICVRKGNGVHETPLRVTLSEQGGVEGDRWADGADRDPEAQVTLMAARVADLVASERTPFFSAGDNFYVDFDLAEEALPAGTRLRVGTAVLEVSSKPHTGCKKFRERFGIDALRWVNHRTNRALRLRGINCRVVAAGEVSVGDAVTLLLVY
jgi:MOSC domain-containing protein YiiM